MTDADRSPTPGDPMTPGERLDLGLSGISQVTNEMVVAYKELDRLVSRWSLLEAVTASPREPAG
jgi:hypothetical protein